MEFPNPSSSSVYKFVYDVETCSEKYKEHIRSKKYGDTITKITKENMIFIHNEKKYIVRFILDFSYDFENGFHYTHFSDFKCNRKIDYKLMAEFEKEIRTNFISHDRMSE